jgi:hypothetical protein
VSKYHGQKITVEDTESYLALFFFNGETIHRQLLADVLHRLDGLIASFHSFTGIRFISSSLFIAYDAEDTSKFTVNLIDFDKYEHTEEPGEDAVIAEGLLNVRKFFTAVLENHDAHLERLRRKDLEVFKEHQVIPQEKIDKYTQ